jgi:uncharacterized protein YbjT (DUF2867 family)
MILVTSAFGNNGRRLIPKLSKKGCKVRALDLAENAREKLKELGATEVIIGDALNPATLNKALRGVTKVLHVGPTFHPKEAEMGVAVIDAALKTGVKHFVYMSVLHPQIHELLQHRTKLKVEQHLINSTLNYTILQPMHYMQNIWIDPIVKEGVFLQASKLETRLSFVDMDDVMEVAAKVLTEEGHIGATYELCSAEYLNAHEVAVILSNVLGKEIKAKLVSEDLFISEFQKMFPDFGDYPAEALRALFKYYSQYGFFGNPNVLTWLLGRAPTTLEQYVRKSISSV